MRRLHRFAWPLVYCGLVVSLTSIVTFMVRDSMLEREWIGSVSTRWRTKAQDTIAKRRAELTMWPGVLAGVGLTGFGILLLELRRRTRDLGKEREQVERRFEDGRPVVFKREDPRE